MLQGKKRAGIDNPSPVPAGPSYRGPLSKRKKCRARHFFFVSRFFEQYPRFAARSAAHFIVHAEDRPFVPVGGMAYAGARGISRVELQVDDGPWQQAQLRIPLSGLTWVLLRYNRLYEHGRHTFRVRCYEGDGTPRIATVIPAEPSGATAIDIKTEMV
jgi:hypothetical protein